MTDLKSHSPIEQALILAQQEIDKAKQELSETSSANGESDHHRSIAFVESTDDRDYQYYQYYDRRKNDVPYKEWARIVPDLDLIHNHYNHSYYDAESYLDVADKNNGATASYDCLEKIMLDNEHTKCDLKTVLDIRNKLKEKIMSNIRDGKR